MVKYRIGDVIRHKVDKDEHLITGVDETLQLYGVDGDKPMCDFAMPFEHEDRYELVRHVGVLKNGKVYD